MDVCNFRELELFVRVLDNFEMIGFFVELLVEYDFFEVFVIEVNVIMLIIDVGCWLVIVNIG